MPKSKPKARQAQAGDNHPPRDLDVIAGEIHHLERNNIFAIGRLLAEAKEGAPGEYGEWMNWLDQFDWSYDTAENYIDAHNLALKFGTVRNLKVPVTVIYGLAKDHIDEDEEGNLTLCDGDLLKAIVRDLDKAAKSAERPLRVADCERIIAENIWECPLPDWLDGASLHRLRSQVPAEIRQKVLEKLNEAQSPLTLRQIINIIDRLKRLDEQDQQGEPEDEQGEPEDEQGEPEDEQGEPEDEQGDKDDKAEPLDERLVEALRTIVHFARRPKPTSVSGIEGVELNEAVNFLQELHRLLTSGSNVQRIADDAEARSRRWRKTA